MSPPTTRRALAPVLGLFAVGLLTHALRVLVWPEPGYWDVSYYRGVASAVAEGRGAVTGAIWNLLYLPPALPSVADVYWSPLPSRVLVPGTLLWGAAGATATGVVLAALWGPLAWATARRLGADATQAVGAGLAAIAGGAFARQASAADCFGLVGALGGAGLWATAAGRWAPAAAAGAGIGLARSDGALFSLAMATGFRGWRAAAVGISGPIAAAAWQARNVAEIGPAAVALRRATARATDIDTLLLGTVPDALGLGARLGALGAGMPGVFMAWVLPTALVGAVLAAVALVRGHGGRLRLPVLLYWLGLPPLLYLLAPGAAHHGALYRSGAAIFPALCALGVLGLRDLNAWAMARRGYAAAFLPGLLGACFVVGSAILGRTDADDALPADLCGPLADVPAGATVFAWDPLAIDTHCGHPAVILLRDTPPDTLASLVQAHDIRYAVLAPDSHVEANLGTAAQMPVLLPGWAPRGPQLWQAPSQPSSTRPAPGAPAD